MGDRGFGGLASHGSQAVAVASVAHETNKQGGRYKIRSIQLGESQPRGTRLCFQFLGCLLHPDTSYNVFLSLWIRFCFFFFLIPEP